MSPDELTKKYQEFRDNYFKARSNYLKDILTWASALLGALIALSDNEQETYLSRKAFALSMLSGILGILLVAIGGLFDTFRAKRILDQWIKDTKKLLLNEVSKSESTPPYYLWTITLIGISFLVFSLLLILFYTLLINVPEWFG